jgi:hypothetical protein
MLNFETQLETMSKICFIFFVLLSANAFAQKNVKESIAFEKPPVIDGDVSDWACDWWIDPDGKFFCNVANDADNLYVRLKVGDDLTQQKIGLFGLSLKLNPSGKRKGKVGLKYPIGKDASEFKKTGPTELDSRLDVKSKLELKKELLGDVEVVELIGLAKQNIISSRLGLANGIESIIITQDDGSYLYEAKIPFKAFRIKKSEVTILGVEFETGKYNPAQKNTPAPQIDPRYKAAYRQGYAARPMMSGNSNYQYNAFANPGYLFVPVRLK